MVVLGGKADTLEEARTRLQEVIDDGSALEKFKVFLKNQGGDASMVDDLDKLPQAKYTFEVEAEKSGFVEQIGSEAMGVASSIDRKSTRLNSSHVSISYAVFCLK